MGGSKNSSRAQNRVFKPWLGDLSRTIIVRRTGIPLVKYMYLDNSSADHVINVVVLYSRPPQQTTDCHLKDSLP